MEENFLKKQTKLQVNCLYTLVSSQSKKDRRGEIATDARALKKVAV